ncbi:MAG: hypothetical protein O6940_00755, partial [Ignavibacteria bacterium]|nr:hypothetical protein [Ignavibacteria bacterium]
MVHKQIKYSWIPKLYVVLIFLLSTDYTFTGNKTWSGSINTNWNMGANWDGGNVPAANDKAIIPTGLTRYPIVTNGTVSIKGIKITGTGSLTIKGGTINTSGKLEFLNTASPFGAVIQSGGTLNVRDLKFTGAGTFLQNENDGVSLLTVSHDYKNNGGGTFSSSGGTIQFIGLGGGGPDFSTGTNQFFNVIIDAAADSKFDNKANSKIKVAGNFTNNNSSLDVTSAEFTFNGAGPQDISSASTPANLLSTFGTLIINKPSGTAKLLSDIGVENTFILTTGTLDQNGKQFYVGSSSTPFPVELVSFNANIGDGRIMLNWLTATEINNFGFEVQRFIMADIWEILGFVEGHGNSNSPKDYSFVDKNPVGGSVFYYRLKQIDIDGQFEYSDIVEVELVPEKYALFQNYPNPFNPTTKIRYQLQKESKVKIKLYDILGAEVISLLNEKKEPGVYEV